MLRTLADEDCLLRDKIASGSTINSLQTSSKLYRELAIGILLQYADSEMAGASAYAQAMNMASSLAARLELSKITNEKLNLAKNTYDLVAETGINVDKYINSHCWEARLQRNNSLGYKRAASDKRVNALMYPIQSFPDLAMFSYLMASMACFQLRDFSKSSFQPWATLAKNHLPVEQSHKDFGIRSIKAMSASSDEMQEVQLSLRYWFDKVQACFGPPASERNKLYIEFGLKCSRNEDLSAEWQNEVSETLSPLGI